jgi:hypothetical protein
MQSMHQKFLRFAAYTVKELVTSKSGPLSHHIEIVEGLRINVTTISPLQLFLRSICFRHSIVNPFMMSSRERFTISEEVVFALFFH